MPLPRPRLKSHNFWSLCTNFPGAAISLAPDLRVTLSRHASVLAWWALTLSSRFCWRCNAQSALGKWRQPPSNSGQSIVQREANSRIPRNPRIQELRFGSRLRAPARVNQTDSHTGMKAGGCPSERWNLARLSFATSTFLFPPLPQDGLSSASQMACACQPYGEQ